MANPLVLVHLAVAVLAVRGVAQMLGPAALAGQAGLVEPERVLEILVLRGLQAQREAQETTAITVMVLVVLAALAVLLAVQPASTFVV